MGRQTSELLFLTSTTIKACIVLFSAEMDFSSQAGLDAAKACATQYWPKGVAACGTETSAEVDAKMTEATMCILDSWKWAMGVVKAVNGAGKKSGRGGRGRGRGRGKGKGKGKAMKKMIMNTLMQAHCEHASNGDATKNAACEQCFKDAVPSKPLTGKRGRGGRGG